MVSSLNLGLSGKVPVKIQTNLVQNDSFYSNEDTVSGEITLDAKCSVIISEITVALSGTSISRLDSRLGTETHQIFHRSQSIFPSEILTERFGLFELTVGKGSHIFPFTIRFPEISECHKESIGARRTRLFSHMIRQQKSKKVHLLRQLPPSIGEVGASAEITYSLDVIVTGSGLPNGQCKSTLDILFCPLSSCIPPTVPYQAIQLVSLRQAIPDCPGRLLWQIDTQLSNGPFLVSGRTVPLKISVTKLCQQNRQIWLQDFQIMLIQTTKVQANGSVSASDQCWMVHTVSDLDIRLFSQDEPAGTVVEFPKSIWASHPILCALSPSFETCNITRTYQLVLRVGFQTGTSKFRVVVREFEFPVHIMASRIPNLRRLLCHRPVNALIADPRSSIDKQHCVENTGK